MSRHVNLVRKPTQEYSLKDPVSKSVHFTVLLIFRLLSRVVCPNFGHHHLNSSF